MTDSSAIEIYVNKIEYGVIYKIKTWYYLKFLRPVAMKLLRNTEKKTTKDKNGKSLPHLEITKASLVYCNIVSNDY